MKKIWKVGMAVGVTAMCITGSTLWASADSEDEAIKEAFIESQNAAQQIGHFESDNGKTDQLSEEQIQGYIDDFNAKMDRYYSSENGCRQTYKEINEQRLRKDAKNAVEYKVDGGVLSCTTENIKLRADGKTATMHVVYVDWGNWVEQNESGQIEVTAPTGQTSADVTMVKEDGQWKLQSMDDMTVCFGADAISDLQEAEQNVSAKGRSAVSVYSAEQQEQMQTFDEYEQKTTGTEYDSFSEALKAAESIDPNEVNPFPLWNEMGGYSLEE